MIIHYKYNTNTNIIIIYKNHIRQYKILYMYTTNIIVDIRYDVLDIILVNV